VPSFVTVTNGNTEQAQDVNQIINALNGSAGNGIPISLTALNDSVNFALAVKNADATNSRSLQVLRSNNNVLIQADVNGVIVSPDGGATTAQVMTVSHTQTLTNKTLTAPHLTSAVVDSGGLTITAGSVTVSNGVLTITNSAGTSSIMTAGGTGSQVAMQFRAGGNAGTDVVRVTLANFAGTEVASFDADGTGTTTRIRGANALALTTNTVDRLTISSAGNTVVNQSGTSLGFFGHAVSVVNTSAASATDLASVIALANNLKTIGQNYGLWN